MSTSTSLIILIGLFSTYCAADVDMTFGTFTKDLKLSIRLESNEDVFGFQVQISLLYFYERRSVFALA